MLIHKFKQLSFLSLSSLSLILNAQQNGNPPSISHQHFSCLDKVNIRSEEGLAVSGYMQMYYQAGEAEAQLNVGAKSERSSESFARLGLRRGRVKLSYSKGLTTGVLSLDLTERNIVLKDAYVRIALPQLGASYLQTGIFNRPFGHEIAYSSVKRESPERALVTRTFFPNERDLGLMFSLSATQSPFWRVMRLDAGLFSGQGIKSDVDSRLDFIGRLSTKHKFGAYLEVSLGFSYYYGAVYQTEPEFYYLERGQFIREEKPEYIGRYVKRIYRGIDTQVLWHNRWGKTEFRGEYLNGIQPGSASSSKSPNGSLHSGAIYLRPASGAYALIAHKLNHLPFGLVIKYDWYDPNTDLTASRIGSRYSGEADVAYHTLGLGGIYEFNSKLRLTLYAEKIWNEQAKLLDKFKDDKQDNRITLALLYKF